MAAAYPRTDSATARLGVTLRPGAAAHPLRHDAGPLSSPRTWVAAALVTLAALAALDLLTGDVVVIVSLFAAAPLLASVGATAGGTAAVGALSVLAAIAITLFLRLDDVVVDDLVHVATVAIVAALSTWTAALRIRTARADAIARATSARLDVAFDRAPVGLAFFDRQGRYLRVNDRLAEINGVPREAHAGRTVAEVLPAIAPSVPIDLRRVLERGEPILDVEVAGETPARPGEEREFLVSYWPVRIDGEIAELGAVVYDVTERRAAERALRTQTERGEALLVAEQAARAEAEAAERRAEFTALLTTALEEGLSVERMAERIATTAVRDYATTCAIWLWRDHELRRAAVAASTRARARLIGQLEAEYPLPRQRAVELLRHNEPRVVRDLDYDALGTDVRHAELLRALGTHDLLILPLRARGRDLGRLVVGFVELRESEEVDLLALFSEVARRAALGLDNARLYEEHTAIARTLQGSLLPPELPRIPGAELAARYVAAGEGNEVGGDFYDAFSLGGDDWAIAIGDVCGKGAEAAAVTALARYTMRAAVLHSSHPRDVLAELNEVLLRHGLEYRFASVVFATARVRPGGATVLLASGGHPLPLVLRADGRVEDAGRPGTLLGIVPTPQLDAEEIALGPGDALLLYTDGVIEASPTDDAFGPARFAAFLSGLAGEDAHGLADRVERAVVGIQNGHPRDDVAVVALRLTPSGRG